MGVGAARRRGGTGRKHRSGDEGRADPDQDIGSGGNHGPTLLYSLPRMIRLGSSRSLPVISSTLMAAASIR